MPLLSARVPVLKYTERVWGLDCDISIQPSGSLLKGRLIRLLQCHFPALSPLYR
jgi:DNA polymerase sigma